MFIAEDVVKKGNDIALAAMKALRIEVKKENLFSIKSIYIFYSIDNPDKHIEGEEIEFSTLRCCKNREHIERVRNSILANFNIILQEE